MRDPATTVIVLRANGRSFVAADGLKAALEWRRGQFRELA